MNNFQNSHKLSAYMYHWCERSVHADISIWSACPYSQWSKALQLIARLGSNQGQCMWGNCQWLQVRQWFSSSTLFIVTTYNWLVMNAMWQKKWRKLKIHSMSIDFVLIGVYSLVVTLVISRQERNLEARKRFLRNFLFLYLKSLKPKSYIILFQLQWNLGMWTPRKCEHPL